MTRTNKGWSRWGVRLGMAAVPTLVVAGVASAAVVAGDERKREDAVVVAAGTDVGGTALAEPALVPSADASSTTSVSVPPASPVSPPSTSRPTAAPTTSAVAGAAGGPTVPTTAAASSSVAAATTASVSLVNQFPGAVRLEVNGTTYELAAGQAMKVSIVPAASGNDAIGVTWVDVPACGVGDAMGYFVAGKSYVLTVVTGLGSCTLDGAKGPDFKVTPV